MTNPPPTPIRSIAGITLNNCQNVPLLRSLFYQPAHFENLDYGIYSVNSSFEIQKAEFVNINNPNSPYVSNAHLAAQDFIGSAIFIQGATTATNKLIKIGDPVVSWATCKFSGCKRGVYLANRSDISVYNCEFSNNTYASVDVRYNNKQTMLFQGNTITDDIQGIRIVNCSKPTAVNISGNIFKMGSSTPLTPPSVTSFPNTALYISNAGIKPGNLNVWNNQFTDYRIAVYQNGISGFSYTGNNVVINRQEPDFQGLSHYGLWIDNSSFGSITYNSVYHNAQLPPSQTSALYGYNFKLLGNSVIENNSAGKCGVAMRFVDNCAATHFSCNDFFDSDLGLRFDNVSIDPQGAINKAAGNSWNNFSNRYRFDGSANFVVDYHHEGATIVTNTESPTPFQAGLVFPYAFAPNDYCTINQRHYDQNRLDAIVNSYVEYTHDSALNAIKDQIAAYAEIMNDDSLKVVYSSWLDDHIGDYVALFALLQMPGSNRDSILPLIEALPISLGQKFLQARNLYCISATNDLFGKDSISYDENELSNLAFQNAWTGTDAIFLARSVLELEVNDLDLGLRIGQTDALNSTAPCGDLVVKDSYGDYILTGDRNEAMVEAYSSSGQLLSMFSMQSKMGYHELAKLRNKDIFLLRISDKGCHQTIKYESSASQICFLDNFIFNFQLCICSIHKPKLVFWR
jgi:parallel beta-helix repeat protein